MSSCLNVSFDDNVDDDALRLDKDCIVDRLFEFIVTTCTPCILENFLKTILFSLMLADRIIEVRDALVPFDVGGTVLRRREEATTLLYCIILLYCEKE